MRYQARCSYVVRNWCGMIPGYGYQIHTEVGSRLPWEFCITAEVHTFMYRKFSVMHDLFDTGRNGD